VNASLRIIAPVVAALAIAGCNAGGSSNIPSSTGATQTVTSASSRQYIPEWQRKHEAKRVCKDLAGGVQCQVLLVTKGVSPNCSPSGGSCGLRPVDMQTRYGLAPYLSQGTGQKVALIELGDMPTAASDLAAYRSAFGLGTASFYKFNQYGQQYNYPESCADFGWCLETDLDIEMVSASCPDCTIYLIEGGNCGGVVCGLEGAEDEAVALGATILSNSWGCHSGVYGANCGDPYFPTHFDTPGIAYLASSGDSAYPEIEYPAALADVLAVGGTQIHKSGSTYTESVWDGAGAGCSLVTKPSWQHDPKCTGRTIADVSAQAGCQPGVAEYDSQYSGDWVSVCGTSVASPLTAGIVGLAGNATSIVGGSTFWELSKKAHKKDFNIISSGSDGSCGDYLCEAGLGKKHGGYGQYSGPAGWGTPKGIAAY
jgi:subtilase family serine protease